MEQPISKIKQAYADEIKVLESNIKDIASGEAPKDLNAFTQTKLDKLAERYQYNEKLGKSRYKLYELQALLHYYNHRDDDALAFIRQAIETKGSSYKRAEHLIEKIEQEPSSLPVNSTEYHYSDQQQVPLELQALTKGTRTSAIIMAVLSFISIYFIPWGIFYIVMATKLKPHEVPSRKLVKGAAIATLPLCTALIPIFIDVEFWRMNKRLKEYEERGVDAFMSDEEYMKGEPKRKRRNKIGWIVISILALLFIVLIAVAIASSSDSSPSYNSTNNTGSSNSFDSNDFGSNRVEDAYQRMESLRSQYESCSADLNARYDYVNNYSEYAVDSYNRDYDECEDTRIRLNNTVDEYNRLAGFE